MQCPGGLWSSVLGVCGAVSWGFVVQCPEFDVEGWIGVAAFSRSVVQCPESVMLKCVCVVQCPEFDVEVWVCGTVSRELNVEVWFVVQCTESLMLKCGSVVQCTEFDVEVWFVVQCTESLMKCGSVVQCPEFDVEV